MLAYKKYQNKNIAIYGMGRTGISVAKTLQMFGANLFCWDDKKNIRKKIKKNFKLNKFWLNKSIINKIVISPGIDINQSKIKKYLKKNTKKIITDLDLFFEGNKSSVIIAITGTNGKSTTCKIIEKILKTAKYKVITGGNIGNPILSFNKTKKKCVFILELSSYQLQYSNLIRSKHAAILNISPDHLERHKSMKSYIKAKLKIFLAQEKTDYSYLSLDNKYSKFIKDTLRIKKIKSNLTIIKKNDCKNILKKINNKYLESNGNKKNIAFAYQIAKNLKIRDGVIIKALNNFKGLPHRQELIFSNKKIECVNDSKATSFDASLQSLLSYNKIYWILGGMPKLKDNFNLRNVNKKIVKAYIIGKSTNFFSKKIGKEVNYTISHNLKNAIKSVIRDINHDKENIKKKYTILFSPAAASFDQFKDFENRGEYFKNLVLKNFS